MRTLYYVPIIHAIEDYGSLRPAIAEASKKRIGAVQFDELQKKIHDYWRVVEERIEKAISNVSGLIIYQDSFPAGDREKILIHFGYLLGDQSKSKSPNFQLIKKLVDKGAILEGTEELSLIVEQVMIYKEAANAKMLLEQNQVLAKYAERSLKLVKLRDEFIAKRIRDTLPDDGKGILFIGKDHDVISELDKLPEKFKVIYL